MDHKGFYDILGEICGATLRGCLKVKDTPLLQAWWDRQTQGCKTEGTLKKKKKGFFYIVFDSGFHFADSLAPHECRCSLALQLPLIKERLANDPVI